MLNQIYSSISDYLGKSDDNIMQNKKLITIANNLSTLYTNKTIKIPQLVVVGTQSAGKSSIINSIIKMDILPTGKNMVTRTPIKLELLYQDSNEINIQFGYYEDCIFKKQNEYRFDSLTLDDQETIREHIEIFTKKYAGSNKGISFKEIVIKISSNQVPNLTLVDLPGLVMVACTDQGQPADIKNQIKDLIKHYILQENTIIMGIIPARCDIEVDSALELIKEYDKNGDRTIGILTKIDLMNENTDVSHYLKNEISSDLKLHYGYYAVKNKNNIENATEIQQDDEISFFNNHPIYKSIDKSRMGITNLSIQLSHILINKIKELIPDIDSELTCKLMNINNELDKMGTHIVVDDNNMNFLLNLYISNFVQNFREGLENYSTSLNYGKEIKDIFINYRKELSNVNPLNNISDNKLSQIISNAEGNRMFFQTTTIEILEKCLIDKDIQSIYKLKNPSLSCVEKIYSLLVKILNDILNQDKFSKYPKLKTYIMQHTLELISQYKSMVLLKLDEFIEIENAYIWTDSNEFREKFNTVSDIQNCNVSNIKNVINLYFKTVIHTFQNYVPKVIMLYMIKNVETSLSHFINKDIKTENIISLLQENDIIYKKRVKLINEKNIIENIKNLIVNI